jgi:hypothetical protein
LKLAVEFDKSTIGVIEVEGGKFRKQIPNLFQQAL